MKRSYLLIVFLATIVLFSCETDIEVNAPYQDITIVYGLIDPVDSLHYIRINKAFLGDANALDLAADATNFNYPAGDLEVIVQEITSSGNTAATYTLVRTVNEVIKDPGVFDDSENVLFRFIEPNINIESTYKLKIYNNKLDKEITSETLIVKSSTVTRPTEQQLLSFWSGAPSTGNDITQLFKVTTGRNVGRVDATLIFNYMEHYNNGDPAVLKSVRMPLGEEIGTNPVDGGDELEWELAGEIFLSNIIAAVPVTVANLHYREVDYIDLEFNVAGTELSTYMTVSAPSTSVNQDKHTYTNINNGLGIFSSRSVIPWNSTAGSPSYQLNINTQTMKKISTLGREFCFGPTTGTSQFGCPY